MSPILVATTPERLFRFEILVERSPERVAIFPVAVARFVKSVFI